MPTRLENYCQIFSKNGLVSGTDDAVISAGRDDELDRQKVLRGIENSRDVELTFLTNQGSNAETAGVTPRHSAGAQAWFATNTSVGTGGSNGGWNGSLVIAATNGTLRPLTETLLKSVMASIFASGGKPNQIYLGPTQKQEFSSFTGIAEIRIEAKPGKLANVIAGADIYTSDYGSLAAIPHQYALTRDVIIIDPEMWAVGTLRGQTVEPLAKSGDAEKFFIVAEKTLVCRNEASSGIIRDVQ